MRLTTFQLGLTFAGTITLFTAAVAVTAAIAAPPPAAPTPIETPPQNAADKPPHESYTAHHDSPPQGAPSAAATADAAPKLPTIRGEDVPAERSEKPTKDEWKQARKLRPHRGGNRCELSLVREWLRVKCDDAPGLGLVAGDPTDVTVWATGSIFGGTGTAGYAIFPLVRGQSRIFSYLETGGEYDWIGVEDDGTLSVAWREGDPDPVILLQRTLDIEK